MALGGKTVGEWKDAMTYDEFLMWDAYRNKRGTLNMGMRMEWLMARLTHQVAVGQVKNPDFKRTLRYHGTIGGGMEEMDFGAAAKMARDSVKGKKRG